jgi:opacity protein-like surface antigen
LQALRRYARLLPLLLAFVAAPSLCGAREYLQVFVTAPFLELHTGPGRGFPVTQVVPREEGVDIIKRRTDWFKVRTTRGVEGWASYKDMLSVVLADGTPFTFPLGDRAGFTSHAGEMGILAGDYSGATLISGYGSYSFNSQLAVELSVAQFLGNASNGTTVDLGLSHVFMPEWRLSPFVGIGTGIVHIEPKATLVAPLDRTDQTAYVGGGVRFYLTRRFFARAEYRQHFVFTSRNDNEKVDEWKLGFAFFF